MSELILIAASGRARQVLTMVRASGQYDVVGLLDDDKEMAGVTVDGAPGAGDH
ncbi:UNVERIFIED_ORG: FlaA1/EpsC-like NDP-sugar epimerase [Arthrobacter sp. UYEF10]